MKTIIKAKSKIDHRVGPRREIAIRKNQNVDIIAIKSMHEGYPFKIGVLIKNHRKDSNGFFGWSDINDFIF